MAVRQTEFWVLLAIAAALAGCRQAADEASREAVEEASQSFAGSVTISEDGQSAIDLDTEAVVRREVRDVFLATGWLAAKPASEVIVKVPATGFVTLWEADPISLGESVRKDQTLAELQVFLSPQEQAQLVAAKEEADILIQQSLASLELAEAHLKRLEESASDSVAGTRLMELRNVVAHSRAAEREAREKLPFLPPDPYEEEMKLKPVALIAPLGGRLTNVNFAPRQLVVQGDPLCTIADWSRLWIRVPVYAPDLDRIDRTDLANVVVPGGERLRDAKPIDIPQAMDPGKQTIELVYEIENTAGELRPGQAVSISLPRADLTQAIVIPRSAIIWDGMGNSWVYVRTAATSFRRRKIELGQLLDDSQVVRRGLNEGDEVVIVGAEALYGEEFKWQLQAEDDD